MQPENEFVAPHFEHSTGGKGVDRPPVEQEAEAETGRIRRLHALLTTELAAATGRARGMLAAPTGGELSARWERDVSVHRWSERVGALTAARSGLCFGRLDHTDEPTSYIGRIGLTDPVDGESALVDWRAPAARPFYCATLATPLGVTRRRHFQLAGTAPDERVAAFHDDVLDGRADSGSASDPALLAALKAPRGSTMRDIVTTIQAEQDAIIRLPLSGVVVIEGGPGTGKTAVALHRVAYLLYTHRERHFERCEARQLSTDLPSAEGQRLTPLARSGVLVVGPSAGFIRYVGGVLPRWASRPWCSRPPAGWRTASSRPPSTRTRWPPRRAGSGCWRSSAAPSPTGRSCPDRRSRSSSTTSPSRSTARMAREARTRARAARLPHNAARATFRDTVGRLLVDQGVERLEQDLEDPPEFAELLGDLPELAAGTAQLSAELRRELRDDLRSDLAFHAAVEQLWPVLSPEQVLAELFASPDRLGSAAAGEFDPSCLHRREGSAWTVADAPLLDELAERLGSRPNRPGRTSRSPTALRIGPTPRRCWAWSRPTGRSPGRTPTRCGRPTSSPRTRSPPGRRPSTGGASRNARPPTGTGGSGTSSSTRRRSSPPWTGTSCCGAARRTRSPPWATSRNAAPLRERVRGRTCSPAARFPVARGRSTVNDWTPAEIMALAARAPADFAPDRQPPESVRAADKESETGVLTQVMDQVKLGGIAEVSIAAAPLGG